MRVLGVLLLACLAVSFLTGCEDIFSNDSGGDGNVAGRPLDDGTTSTETVADSTGDATQAPGEDPPAPSTDSPRQVPAGFAGVRWLHTNVSAWPETASLSAGVSGSSVLLNYDKSRSWPSAFAGGTEVNANAWIFVYRGGTWYAATWEWLRPGQTSKSTRAVAGDHIKKSPLNDFSPVSGEYYGFMVSGLARDSTRNVQERSNVDMVRWP